MKISYPVAVDSEHLIWRGFRNQYWPALYFIDTQGSVELEDHRRSDPVRGCDGVIQAQATLRLVICGRAVEVWR
jgi:hypothetical protein